METKDLNQLRIILAETRYTNKWLTERLDKDSATVSKWCTNSVQPNLENLIDNARFLEYNFNELLKVRRCHIMWPICES